MRMRTQRFEGEPGPAGGWREGDVLLDLYEVRGVLGEGGMGKVFRVRHRGWNMDLAVKCPRTEFLRSSVRRENFVREAETWVTLGLHPHVVSCYYVRTIDGAPRIFAECVEGGTLRDWIQDGRLRQLPQMLDVAIQFAWGLHFAHGRELIHQDVKPANVMMTPAGVAKVTDFGLAKARAVSGEETSSLEEGEAGQSVLVSAGGRTPAYCSPEQAKGASLNWRTDLYSWAVSMLEMFTGEVTWMAGPAAPLVLKHYRVHGPEIEGIPRMPDALADLLARCLQPDPGERPDSMEAVTKELRAIYEAVAGEPYARLLPDELEARAAELNNRALSLLDLGKTAEAEACFEQGAHVDPHHTEIVYNRGLARWRGARITEEEFLSDLQEVCATHKRAWLDHYLLGLVYLEASEGTAACEALEKAQELSGGRREIARALAHARTGVASWSRCAWTVDTRASAVTAAAFHPRGHRIMSADRDGRMAMWDVEGGTQTGALKAHGDAVRAVAFLPDGQRAVTGSWDRSLKVWDLASATCLRTFSNGPHRVGAAALTSSGEQVVTAGWSEGNVHVRGEYEVRVWDLNTGACRHSSVAHPYPITALGLWRDDRHALIAGQDGVLKVLDVTQGGCPISFQAHEAAIQAAVLTPDGRRAIFVGADGALVCCELATAQRLWCIALGTPAPEAVVLTPDGRQVLTAMREDLGTDRAEYRLRLWDVHTGRRLRTLGAGGSHATEPLTALAIAPDGSRALTGDRSGVLRLWNVERSGFRADFAVAAVARAEDVLASQKRVTALIQRTEGLIQKRQFKTAYINIRKARMIRGYERDTRLLELAAAITDRGRRVGFRNAFCQHVLSGHAGPVSSVAVSPLGAWMLSGSADGSVRLWQIQNGECTKTLLAGDEPVRALTLMPDGTGFLAGTECGAFGYGLDGQARGVYVDREDGRKGVNDLALTPDGRWVLAAFTENIVKCWDASQPETATTFRAHGQTVHAVRSSPEGRFAASAGDDLGWLFWRLPDAGQPRRAVSERDQILALVWSLDGRAVVTGNARGEVKVWDVAEAESERTLIGHRGGVLSVDVLADGQFAVSGGADKTVRIWSLETGRCLRTLHGHQAAVTAVAFTRDGRHVISGSLDGTARIWEMDWEWEFPEPMDWDARLRSRLEIFLEQHGGLWELADWKRLIAEIRCAGFGWVREEGIRTELELLRREYETHRTEWLARRYGVG